MKSGYYDMAKGVTIDLLHGKLDDNISVITRIKVRADKRGRGYASEVMMRVLEDADEEQCMLVLAVESYDDGLSNEQLVEWYERMGFCWEEEAIIASLAHIEPGNGLVMVRRPRKV